MKTWPIRLLVPLILAAAAHPAAAAEPVRIHETFANGPTYVVQTRADLSGSITLPPEKKDTPGRKVAVRASARIEYAERVLEAEGRLRKRTVRSYRQMDLRREIGGQLQQSQLRKPARRVVVLRDDRGKMVFSPDGPLTWAEVERMRTEVFLPALAGLFPTGSVTEGESWPAGRDAVLELTDLVRLTDNRVRCRLQAVVQRGGRPFAHVAIEGTVTGDSQDGPNRQRIEGYYLFDLQDQFLSYLFVSGSNTLLDGKGKPVGQVQGRWVLARRREACPELADATLPRRELEPRRDNTLLLFDEPALGVRFEYPRRWSVRKADARQIVLDEPSGGGLLITLEPLSRLPKPKDFHKEVATWLPKRAARIVRSTRPNRLSGGVGKVHQFEYEAEVDRQAVLLDYYVVRQSVAGATFAGKYPKKLARELQQDATIIARSLRLIPPTKRSR